MCTRSSRYDIMMVIFIRKNVFRTIRHVPWTLVLLSVTRNITKLTIFQHFESSTCDGDVENVVKRAREHFGYQWIRKEQVVVVGHAVRQAARCATPRGRKEPVRGPDESSTPGFRVFSTISRRFFVDLFRKPTRDRPPDPFRRKPGGNPTKTSVHRFGVLCPHPAAYEYGILHRYFSWRSDRLPVSNNPPCRALRAVVVRAAQWHFHILLISNSNSNNNYNNK